MPSLEAKTLEEGSASRAYSIVDGGFIGAQSGGVRGESSCEAGMANA